MKFRPSHLQQTPGFSLIEVTMAIGIFTFCLITIMGLIPVALKTSRASFDKNIETRMVQAVQANLIQKPYSTILINGSFIFDSEGSEITLPSSTEIRFRVFYANQNTTSLPASQSAPKLTTSLVTISNTITAAVHTNSLHLPDNGF